MEYLINNSNVLELIRGCSKEWQQIIELLAKQHAMTFLQWRILLCIDDEGSVEQQIFAKKLNLLNNNLIVNIETLVKKGFLQKSIKSSDKKLRILKISKEKTAIVSKIKAQYERPCDAWSRKFYF